MIKFKDYLSEAFKIPFTNNSELTWPNLLKAIEDLKKNKLFRVLWIGKYDSLEGYLFFENKEQRIGFQFTKTFEYPRSFQVSFFVMVFDEDENKFVQTSRDISARLKASAAGFKKFEPVLRELSKL